MAGFTKKKKKKGLNKTITKILAYELLLNSFSQVKKILYFNFFV
jgi:hypothetical protein